MRSPNSPAMGFDVYSDGSSSPLSSPEHSPTPPDGYPFLFDATLRPSYPSPSSSQYNSAKASPLPDSTDSATGSAAEDSLPPPKRRKLSDPKVRVTQHIDLRPGSSPQESDKIVLDRLLNVLHKKKKIVVIAGAGISVSAGIPDFRSSTGLFKTLRNEHNLKSSGKDLFDASVYKDGSSTTSFHAMVRTLSEQSKAAKPTAFHHLLATLAHEGRLLRLYSQNIDGIDTSIPPLATHVPLGKKGPWPKTIQVHGGLDKMVCTKCHDISDLEKDLFDGPVPPLCKKCLEHDSIRTTHGGKRSHGIGRLRPRMVLYNENGPDDEAIGSVTTADLKTRPDALIVVGTTLKVPGVKRIAKEMCNVVRDRRDGLTIWMNNDPEPSGKDFAWDVVVRGPCDEVARLAAMPRYDDEQARQFKVVTDDELKRIKDTCGLKEVVVCSPRKNRIIQDAAMGVLTPLPSPKLRPAMGDTVTVTPKKASATFITNDLGDSNSTTAAKPPTKAKRGRKNQKKTTDTTKKAPMVKITNSFAVSKSAATATKTGGKKRKSVDAAKSLAPTPKVEPTFSIRISLKPENSSPPQQLPQLEPHPFKNYQFRPEYPQYQPQPMHPISLQEARNNTLPPLLTTEMRNFPDFNPKFSFPKQEPGKEDGFPPAPLQLPSPQQLSAGIDGLVAGNAL